MSAGKLPGLMRYRYQKKDEEKLISVTSPPAQGKHSGGSAGRLHTHTSPVANHSNHSPASRSPVIQQQRCPSQNYSASGSVSAVIGRPLQQHSGIVRIQHQHKNNMPVANGHVKAGNTQRSVSSSQSQSPGSPVFSGVKKIITVAPQRPSSGQNPQWITASTMKNQNHRLVSPPATKQRQQHTQGSSQSSSQSSGQSSSQQSGHFSSPQAAQTSYQDREMLVHISSLTSMFPNKHRDEMEQALRAAGNNLDQAVDFLIDNKFAEYTVKANKRKAESIQISSPSSVTSPVQPVAKRARKLSFDDDDDDVMVVSVTTTPLKSSPGTTPVKQTSQMNNVNAGRITSPIPSPVKTAAQIHAGKVAALQSAFPGLPRHMIVATMTQNNNEVDKTTAALTNMCSKQVSKTENAGSIKAMTQARVIAKAAGQMTSPTKSPGQMTSQTKSPGQMTSPTNGVSSSQPSPPSSPEIVIHRKRVREKPPNEIAVNEDENDEEYNEEAPSSDEEEDIYKGQEGLILKFVNESALTDLLSIDGCSKKKAQCIIQLRPFESWEDMAQQFHETKLLSVQLLAECKEVLRIRDSVQKLMQKCTRISREIETIVSSFRGKIALEETNADYITKQPTILNKDMQLTPYQIVGLNWLVVMHDQELNGILGDEMGLGKTIQTIAFLAYMKEQGEDGPHLVIAPSSTLDNWLRELRTWCPSLRVLMYYGSQEERSNIRAEIMSGTHEEFDVAVTTYNMATGSVDDRSLFKKFSWHYAIFDEGHMLKNMTSMRYKSLAKIRAYRRLLLTGTPLQNNLIELMSLLAFVMPDMFTNKTDHLKKIFASMTGKTGDERRSAYELENLGHAKQILKPFFLRRLKTEVLQQLPKKKECVKHLPLAFEQRELYDNLKKQFNKTVRENKADANGLNNSAMMMQLRKAANHHLLHRQQYDLVKLRKMAKDMLKEPTHYESVEQYVFEDMEVMSDFELHQLCKQYKSLHKYQLDEDMVMESSKFRYLDELLPELKGQGDRVLLFSQFTMVLDIVEVYMAKRGHKFLRLDGQTPVAERMELIDKFNTDHSIFIFLLSTKAGGLGINLTAANVVILHDIDFNPYNDKQAEDRCHRLGQTRDVMIYRLLSANTIEEGMLKCTQAKLRLEQDITGSAKGDELETRDVESLLKSALDIKG